MSLGQPFVRKIRYYSSVSTIYGLTLLFGLFAFFPSFYGLKNTIVLAKAVQSPPIKAPINFTVISGRPVRIVIPASGVDLPIDPGYYDSSTNSWTLSGYRAQYAMISTLANNVSGDTFIYGHNNNYVFGALRHVTPSVGAQALIYTDNGHELSYVFQKSFSLAPDDTSVLNYSGKPILTIQTCTGGLNEWRTMYQFAFQKVIL